MDKDNISRRIYIDYCFYNDRLKGVIVWLRHHNTLSSTHLFKPMSDLFEWTTLQEYIDRLALNAK